jgi:hypothetical protein
MDATSEIKELSHNRLAKAPRTNGTLLRSFNVNAVVPPMINEKINVIRAEMIPPARLPRMAVPKAFQYPRFSIFKTAAEMIYGKGARRKIQTKTNTQQTRKKIIPRLAKLLERLISSSPD